MHDMPQAELDEILAERQKIFTPKWFVSLVSGRLSPGDTFWLGNYGVLLFVVPTVVLLAMLLAIAVPGQMAPILYAIALLAGLYRVAILRALISASVSTPGPKGWRITGILWTAIEAAGLIGYAWMNLAA